MFKIDDSSEGADESLYDGTFLNNQANNCSSEEESDAELQLNSKPIISPEKTTATLDEAD